MENTEAVLSIGPSAITAYSRLSYTMWYALAEFIDNSTQSRENYDSIIDAVLQQEGRPLLVEITYNRMTKELRIKDNSIGMTLQDLIEALKIANPTKDSVGRSKYGLGMKTAACWIGKKWQVITCEFASGQEWTASVDVSAVAQGNDKVPLTSRSVSRDEHYTEIVISELYKSIQKRSEDVIKTYLGSMYRNDIKAGKLIITFNGDPVPAPEDSEWDTDPSGLPMKKDLPEVRISGKRVKGWIGVLKRGGRRYGGFSIFKHGRQIEGFPKAWKPRSIYGGVDDEGANNLAAAPIAERHALVVDGLFRRILRNEEDQTDRRNLRILVLEGHARELRARVLQAGISGWTARTRDEKRMQDARIAYYAKALRKVERRLADG